MFQRSKLNSLDEYFLPLNQRNGNKVFFYRFTANNKAVSDFLRKYFDFARKNGVVIDGRIPNADQSNLNYYYEMLGDEFSTDRQFIMQKLKKWLPRMNQVQLEAVGGSLADTLNYLKSQGKNENMLKNAYIKFMCWLYYRFERITSRLGDREVPKIIYCGTMTHYELLLISMLSGAGCDVVFVEPSGDADYLRFDPRSELSELYRTDDGTPFPPDFNLKKIQEEALAEEKMQKILGTPPQYKVNANSWTDVKGLETVLSEISERGGDDRNINTVFCRINGVEDKTGYVNELISFRSAMKSRKRSIVAVNDGIDPPTADEVSKVSRGNYTSPENAVSDLAKNISFGQNPLLGGLMKYEFIKLMLDESKELNLNRLSSMGVYVICCIKRWASKLFNDWNQKNIPCFVLFGVCRNENEALFMKYLSKLPLDVLILNTVVSRKCALSDPSLKEVNYSFSLEGAVFPDENVIVRAGTVAYHAERELDTLMYQDSGIYRNYQYSKATSIVLETMFEEIEILWDQELKFRPNFSTDDNEVKMPVIFSKISGVKDGAKDKKAKAYWSYIKSLMTPETIVWDSMQRRPLNTRSVNYSNQNPVKQYASMFFKNGVLQRSTIKQHSCYKYKVLRPELQDHILDKLQLLIDSKIIKGTFENGTEYSIISAVLNMSDDIVRKLQNFDFTKKNPKLIYINTTDKEITFDDAVVLEFLSLAGFDVLFFVPTGYNNIEVYYAYPIISEHQAGEYIYDLRVPDFSHISANAHRSWRDRLFRRGV